MTTFAELMVSFILLTTDASGQAHRHTREIMPLGQCMADAIGFVQERAAVLHSKAKVNLGTEEVVAVLCEPLADQSYEGPCEVETQ